MLEYLKQFVDFIKTLMHWTDGVPEKSWTAVVQPILGRPYDPSRDHDWKGSFEFYWREVWHFLGGAAQGIIFSFLFLFLPNLLAAVIPSVGVAIVIGLKEFLGDASEQENGWDFKNVTDTIVWTLGTAAISFSIYFLVN